MSALVSWPGWRPETLAGLVWWVAVALALRSVFEPVMVAYYLWPVLAAACPTRACAFSNANWTTRNASSPAPAGTDGH